MPRALVLLLLLAVPFVPLAHAETFCGPSPTVICTSGPLGARDDFLNVSLTWWIVFPSAPDPGLFLQAVSVGGLPERIDLMADPPAVRYLFGDPGPDPMFDATGCDYLGAGPWRQTEATTTSFEFTNAGGGASSVCALDEILLGTDAGPFDLGDADATFRWVRTASLAPEPAPLALVATGLLALALLGVRRRAHQTVTP